MSEVWFMFMQPFITLFRCNPKSKYRPIFNWFHWLFGTVAYVLQCKSLSAPVIYIITHITAYLCIASAFIPPAHKMCLEA